MLQSVKNACFKHNFEIYGFFTFWLIAFMLIINYQRYADDVSWIAKIEELGGWWNATLFYSKSWQPRYAITVLQMILVSHLFIWKIVNSFCLTLSLFLIYKIASKNQSLEKNKLYVLLGVFSAFWLIYVDVLVWAYYWLAGSPVYNIAFTATLISVLPFIYLIRGDKNLITKFTIIPLMIISFIPCYNEQTSVLLTGFSVFVLAFLLYRKIKIPKMFFVYCAWIVANSVFFNIINFRAPRNIRELRWMPNFQMLSIIDKIFQAVSFTNYNVLHVSGFLFLACTGLTAYIIYKKYNTWVRFIGFIPLIYSLMSCVPFESIFSLGGLSSYTYPISSQVFGYGMYSSSTVSDFNTVYLQLLPAMGSVFIIILFGFLLFFVFENIREKVIVSVLYAGGLIVSYALGFTGAFFAIGGRGFFIINMIMLFLFVSQCRVAINFAGEKTVKKAGIVFVIFCSMFLIRTVILCLNIMERI